MSLRNGNWRRQLLCVVAAAFLFIQSVAALAAIDPGRIGPVRTSEEAHATMQYIKAELPPGDGLAAFNDMYISTTNNFMSAAREGRFENPAFIERLIQEFANLYFSAVRSHFEGSGRAPLSWQTLLSRSGRAANFRTVQFAATGMSAHIGRDLPVVLKTLFEDRSEYPAFDSPEHRDYERANDILGQTFDEIETELFGDLRPNVCGVLLRGASNVLARPSLKAMRFKAWFDGKALWRLRDHPILSWNYLTGLDVGVAASNRAVFALKPSR